MDLSLAWRQISFPNSVGILGLNSSFFSFWVLNTMDSGYHLALSNMYKHNVYLYIFVNTVNTHMLENPVLMVCTGLIVTYQEFKIYSY